MLPSESMQPSSLKFKGLYLNNLLSLGEETKEACAVAIFSTVCGSVQMSVGLGKCGGDQGAVSMVIGRVCSWSQPAPPPERGFSEGA